MQRQLMKLEFLLVVQALAFWPVWRWYAGRVTDGSDEAWGWVALLTAVLFVFRQKPEHEVTTAALELPAALTLCYAFGYHFLSPLPRAVIAVTAIGATVSIARFGKRLHLGIWGLLVLSLPVIASLQFYLGFPLRALVAKLAAPMLRLNGLAVVSEGASLNWNGTTVLIDAPCSGVKMLWTGFFLTFTLACYFKLSAKRTLLACAFSFAAIIIGNTFRAVGLFYIEAGVINFSLPGWTHEGLGVVVFLVTATAIALSIQRMSEEKRCGLHYSSSAAR
ncbi:MAG: archaeosortase/exosortase family protein [Blastocatellales bacterium]